MKSFFVLSVVATSVGVVGNPAVMALTSATVPGPSDIGVGAGPVVENVVPQSSGGEDFFGEAVPHFCADCVGEKDTPRSLERDDLSVEAAEALSHSRSLTPAQTPLLETLLCNHLETMTFWVEQLEHILNPVQTLVLEMCDLLGDLLGETDGEYGESSPFRADPVVERGAPSSGGDDLSGETVEALSHSHADHAVKNAALGFGEKQLEHFLNLVQTLRLTMLLHHHVEVMTYRVKQLKRFLTPAQTLLLETVLHNLF